MTQETSSKHAPVSLQILDKEYRIACPPGERHGLVECARLLDERMREVRQNGRVIGADRVAVMAALNLIYELAQERDRYGELGSRLKHLQERLSNAVAAAAEPAVAPSSPALRQEPEAPAAGLDVQGESV